MKLCSDLCLARGKDTKQLKPFFEFKGGIKPMTSVAMVGCSDHKEFLEFVLLFLLLCGLVIGGHFMAFIVGISCKSDKVNKKGPGKHCDPYCNQCASNYVHFWTYLSKILIYCSHSFTSCHKFQATVNTLAH